MTSKRQAQGFTLLEILTVVAVIVILGAIAITGYQSYVARARASEIVLKYDAIRTAMGAALAGGQQLADCAELAKRLGNTNLKDEHAQLAYGFEAVTGGYRPVLTVCAKTDSHGAVGVGVARGAHETLSKSTRVEAGAVLTDTLVSFAVPLSDAGKSVCTVAVAAAQGACGQPPSASAAKPPAQAPAQAQTQASTAGPPDRPVPRGLKAGSTPNAPWLSPMESFGEGVMQATWTDKDIFDSLRARSPDGSAMTVSGIDVDPSLATVTRDPDGTWRINFLKRQGVNPPIVFTVRIANGAGSNSGEIHVRH